jgi:hypothetical protein
MGAGTLARGRHESAILVTAHQGLATVRLRQFGGFTKAMDSDWHRSLGGSPAGTTRHFRTEFSLLRRIGQLPTLADL